MGIIGVLILVAKRPKNRIGDVAEKLFFLLTCLSLPFAWFYLPITLVDRFKYKAKNTFFLLVALLASAAQGLGYLTSHVSRSPVTLLSLFSKWTLLELYNEHIKQLPITDRLRLATLILNEIAPVTPIDASTEWTDEDLRDLAKSSWDHIEKSLADEWPALDPSEFLVSLRVP